MRGSTGSCSSSMVSRRSLLTRRRAHNALLNYARDITGSLRDAALRRTFTAWLTSSLRSRQCPSRWRATSWGIRTLPHGAPKHGRLASFLDRLLFHRSVECPKELAGRVVRGPTNRNGLRIQDLGFNESLDERSCGRVRNPQEVARHRDGHCRDLKELVNQAVNVLRNAASRKDPVISRA